MNSPVKFSILLTLLLSGTYASPVHAEVMTRDEIIEEAVEMALTRFDDMNWNFWSRTWVDGVFWIGVSDLTQVSDDPNLQKALLKMGRKRNRNMEQWTLSYVKEEEQPHHADDMMIAQTFIDYYVESEDQDPIYIADAQRRLELASDEILSEERAAKASNKELDWKETIVWHWCDALFMAPVAHIRMSEITGDPKYLEAMHLGWKRTSDLLYDPDEHLYYRDWRFLDMKSEGGEKVFWSRGNGWVFGALARVLTYLPEGDPNQSFYVSQFKEMAAKLASIQQPNGSWTPSLADPEEFPYSEASGTAFFCYGMAWGINNGVLDAATYRPVVEKAWAALMAAHRQSTRGYLGYVQGVGDRPGEVFALYRALYGDGAFMMAAVQLAQMAPLTLPDLPPLLEETDYPNHIQRIVERDQKFLKKKAAKAVEEGS